MFGYRRAKELKLHCVPPEPLSGRWGQCSKCEKRFAPFQQHALIKLINFIVQTRAYWVEARLEQLEKDTAAAAAAGRGKGDAKGQGRGKGRGRGRGKGRGRGGPTFDEPARDSSEAF